MKDRTVGHSGRLIPAVVLAMLAGALLTVRCGGFPQQTQAQRKAEEARTRLASTEGGGLVLRAIEAHGGLEQWYNTATSAFAWELSHTGLNFRFKSYQVVDNASRRAYHTIQILGTPDNPSSAAGRFAWDGTEAWISPASIEGFDPRFWTLLPYYFQLIPFVLADPGLNYEKLPDADLDGTMYDMVKVTFDPGTGDTPDDYYVLYLERSSGQVAAIRYTLTYGGGPSDQETLLDYENFVTVDGLSTATRYIGYSFQNGTRGSKQAEAWTSEISFQVPFDAAQLEKPEDVRVQPLPDA